MVALDQAEVYSPLVRPNLDMESESFQSEVADAQEALEAMAEL